MVSLGTSKGTVLSDTVLHVGVSETARNGTTLDVLVGLPSLAVASLPLAASAEAALKAEAVVELVEVCLADDTSCAGSLNHGAMSIGNSLSPALAS